MRSSKDAARVTGQTESPPYGSSTGCRFRVTHEEVVNASKGMTLTVQVAGKSDIGCVRANNEDNFGYDARYGIYLVCDGMGGQAAGEVASKIAVDTVLAYCRQAGSSRQYPPAERTFAGVSQRANALGNAIQLANRAIHRAAAGNPGQNGMGSTLAAALVEDRRYSIAHVGDSRIYLLRKGAIRQLTNDHSLVMEQVRRGLMSPEQAQHSELQNIIIRALGSEENVEPDLSDMTAELSDTLLLTSDGLTRQVQDDRILDIVENADSLPQACERLIEAAKQGGGHDNITCLILRFVEKSWLQKVLSPDSDGTPSWQDSL